jgi:L-threonate 2-dehydrogenase
MARTLAEAGFRLRVYDVRPANAAEVVGLGAELADSPRAATTGAAGLVLMVQNAAQADAALLGPDGALAGLARGTWLLLACTVSPTDAARLAEACAAVGVDLLDGPVSGGPTAAAEGRLSLMLGGSAELIGRVQPVLDALGDPRRTWHVGPAPGNGQSLKMINQLMAGINIAASCEALALAAKAGLDRQLVYEVVRQSAGGSWMFNDRVPRMLAGSFSPPRSALDIFVKDLGIVCDASDQLQLPLFVASAAQQVFKAAAAAGLGHDDDAGLIRLYESLGGLTDEAR